MGWRPGELWFDADVLWFRETAAVPVAVSFPPLPAAGTPVGLVASRQRRAAWERRRRVRRKTATVLALSPAAVVLGLAAQRATADSKGRVLTEDPPSETYRIPGGIDRVEAARAATAPPAAVAPAERAGPPAIAWNRATSVGLPHGGSLVDGTQLPVEGPDWVTWNPVTDSTPNVPNRLYGHERTIRKVLAVTHAYREANPGAPRVVVGDLSRKGGGPMHDEHVSHQNGLDVDVYFPRRDGALRAPLAPTEIDGALTQDLVDRFVAAGAEKIFVGHSSGLRGPAGVVVPYSGHEYHMHVRFPDPG